MNTATITTLNSSAAASIRPVAHDIRGKLTLARLPALPQVLTQLLEFCQRDDVGLNELATLMGRDVALTARIFELSNAAAYHGRGRPATLTQCLGLLGIRTVKTAVIHESISQVFKRLTSGTDVDLRRFWEHSLRGALLAEELARLVDYHSPEEAYLGGLIHDVGQLAMLTADPEGYRRIFCDHSDDEAICAVELEQFALTHPEVGAWLIDKWALNSFLGDCVLYHHEPAERVASAHPLVRIVQLADRLAHVRDGVLPPTVREALSLYNIAIPDPDSFLANIDGEVGRVARELGIDLPAPGAVRSSTPEPHRHGDPAGLQLASRLEEILLVDQAFAKSDGADQDDSSLAGYSRALKLLFGVEGAAFFEATERDAENFNAKPLSPQWAHLAQLDFRQGHSASLLAQSAHAGPIIATRRAGSLHILDEQLLRAIGGAGLLYLPLRIRNVCLGVLVGSIATEAGAEALQNQSHCLERFCRMAAVRLLELRRTSQFPPPAGDSVGSDGRIRHFAHEISNPLSIIRNYLSLLESENSRQGTPRAELGIVREEIDRVSKMVNALRQPPGTSDAPDLRPLSVNRLAEDLVTLFRESSAIPGKVAFEVDLAPNLPSIVSDADRLKQLLLNLIKNAVESMPGGGTVRVSTTPWGNGGAATHVQICVQDTGPGIRRDILTQLYQPVKTSKGEEHQGLGLAIVGQLVRDLKGLINCRTDVRGTSFQILLPVAGT